MTLWIIGFLFTLGYFGYFKTKLRFWQALGYALATLAMWPMVLGMELGGRFDDEDDDESDSANTVISRSDNDGSNGEEKGGE